MTIWHSSSTSRRTLRELSLHRLTAIREWLWVAGRPVPPRPLHRQLITSSRRVVVDERLDMHLVWTADRIFLKPLPRYLLYCEFWEQWLACRPGCSCSALATVGTNTRTQSHEDDTGSSNHMVLVANAKECRRRTLWKTALGFIYSYTALIRYESDLFWAKQNGLLPKEIEWHSWRAFVGEILGSQDNIYHEIDSRFIYGELRLGRLDMIYRLTQGAWLRSYLPTWHSYGDFVRDNLAALASGTAYFLIVLTALQVGLDTHLGKNQAFQEASYEFVLFSIIGPLVAIGILVLTLCIVFWYNWAVAVNHWKRRLRHLKLAIYP